MISIKWIGVILWSIAGLIVLLTPGKVPKFNYAMAWGALMLLLVEEALAV